MQSKRGSAAEGQQEVQRCRGVGVVQLQLLMCRGGEDIMDVQGELQIQRCSRGARVLSGC